MPQKRWALAVIGLLLYVLTGRNQAWAEGALRTNETFIVDVWLTENGLPQNEVTSILQAHDGYLWFGTLNGLVRFDGTRFVVFDESNTPGLESARILFLFEDHLGRLWLGTDSAGVALFEHGR